MQAIQEHWQGFGLHAKMTSLDEVVSANCHTRTWATESGATQGIEAPTRVRLVEQNPRTN